MKAQRVWKNARGERLSMQRLGSIIDAGPAEDRERAIVEIWRALSETFAGRKLMIRAGISGHVDRFLDGLVARGEIGA